MLFHFKNIEKGWAYVGREKKLMEIPRTINAQQRKCSGSVHQINVWKEKVNR